MDIFTEKKLLIRVIVVLGILNICCIGVFIWKVLLPPPQQQAGPAGGRDASEILKRELGLTKEQVDRIREIRADFSARERQLVQAIRQERDSMNAMMFRLDTDEALVTSLARNISENEYRMELLRYRQSLEIKSICSPEQVQKMEKLIREMTEYLRPQGKNDNRPNNRQGNGPQGDRRKDPPGQWDPNNRPPKQNDNRQNEQPSD